MKKETITIRIPEEISNRYKDVFKYKTTGAQEAAEAFLFIRVNTIEELKGVFNENELTVLFKLLHNNDTYSMNSKNILLAKIDDYQSSQKNSNKENIDFNVIKEKIKTLNAAQIYFIQSEINRYWKEENNNLDMFLKELI